MTYPSKSPFGFPQVHSDSMSSHVLNGGEIFVAKPVIDANTADAAVLYTTPANLTVMLIHALWEVTTAWTGGSSSAIGISSNATGYTTKGDVHGGAAGDVLATLTVGLKRGTQGAKITGAPNAVILPPSSTIRFDRITSAFTAGAGRVVLVFMVVA